jgi:pyruvate/2-oxoglutarate dehydrogenase complex dihydrolipoamide dehydrogenase (E3) component
MHLGVGIAEAKVRDGKAVLTLRSPERAEVEVTADHVIAATGYKVSLPRLTFIDESLKSRIHTADEAPILDRHYESSVPRLYFIGTVAANSFGPLLRFAYGAEYTAKRVAARLRA